MIVLWTDSLKGYGLNRIFEMAKKADYDGIDLAVNYSNFDSFNVEYINKLSKETDLPIYSISAPENIESAKIREVIEFGKKVGAKVVIVQPPSLFEFNLSSWLKKEVPKIREKEKISVALENAPNEYFLGILPGYSMSNIQELKKFKHVSIDTARIAEKKQDLIRTYASLKKFLVHVHLSNFSQGKKYMPLNQGILPLESFLTKLKQDNYPGAISIKILPRMLSAGNDDKVVDSLKDSKKYFDKYFTNVEVIKQETEVEFEDLPSTEN